VAEAILLSQHECGLQEAAVCPNKLGWRDLR
jgi:hypothetical protein